ncbi:MAG: aromatic ring-hydroxylating oxygenase subunit alpha [Porticoccaceae bacterium]
MKQETRIQLAKRALELADKGEPWRANEVVHHPVAAYCDAGWLQREQDILFRKYPLLAAFSQELPEKGSFVAMDETGIPVLLVRDATGQVNAFVNACRHRGTRLLQGCGRALNSLVCPYHAWTYGLDGELRVIPDKESFPGIDRHDKPLIKLPVVEKYGMIWVCPTPGETFDIDRQLGGLAPELESYQFGGYVHYTRRVLHRQMNWKMMLDTFLEPYHFAALHARTVGPYFVNNLCLFDAFDQNLREVVVRRSITKVRDLPEQSWDIVPHAAVVYILFPNTALVMQIDHVELWRSYPVAGKPGECTVTMDFFIPEPAVSEAARARWDKSVDITVRTVFEEDIRAVESIQAGINSGAQSHVIFGRNEPALAHYQQEIAKSIGC